MHTAETFYKPGLEPAEDVLTSLPPKPRAVHAAGRRLAVLWRMLVCLVSYVACGLIVINRFDAFVESASMTSWAVIVAVIPLCLVFVPWKLIKSYRAAMKSFRICRNIYENGVPTIGTINTLTYADSNDLISHHTERAWSASPAKVRLDYTFAVNGSVRTGTITLREQSINYLSMNSDICILYLPDAPSQNMLFPIPGYEFFECQAK